MLLGKSQGCTSRHWSVMFMLQGKGQGCKSLH